MNILLACVAAIGGALQRALEWLVAVMVMLLVAAVLWGVLTRTDVAAWLGLSPSLWTEELSKLLLIWVTFLAAAVAFAHRQHLGLDYFASLLDPDARRWLRVVVELIIIAFSATVLVHGGMILVGETLKAEQLTPAMQIKMGYVYLAAPLAGISIILFAIHRILELMLNRHRAEEATATISAAGPD